MTHAQLLDRRTALFEQLRQHSVACEQIRGAIALLDELIAGDPAEVPDPSTLPAPVNGADPANA